MLGWVLQLLIFIKIGKSLFIKNLCCLSLFLDFIFMKLAIVKICYELVNFYLDKNRCNVKNNNCEWMKEIYNMKCLGDEIVLMVINKLQRGPVNDVKLLRVQFVSFHLDFFIWSTKRCIREFWYWKLFKLFSLTFFFNFFISVS